MRFGTLLIAVLLVGLAIGIAFMVAIAMASMKGAGLG